MDAKSEFESKLSSIDSAYARCEQDVYERMPVQGYAAPMLLEVASRFSNEIVDRAPQYASVDHGINFQILLRTIDKCISNIDEFEPFFDGAVEIHDDAYNAWEFETARHRISYYKASAKNGLWLISHAPEWGYDIRVDRRLHRTALNLLSIKADFLESSPALQEILKDPGKYRDHDHAKVALLMGLDDLAPLRCGLKSEWNKFLDTLGVKEAALLNIQAFITYINDLTHKCWFKEDALSDLLGEFELAYECELTEEVDRRTVLRLVSPTLQEACAWGIAAPFVRIGGWYMRWPFAYHVIHPNLTLLALLMKQNPAAWNNTVGSSSGDVSKYIASQLPDNENIFIASCRIKKGVGDVDLAFFNKISGEVLICEVKTVFDRFRSNHKLSNFVDQRVNYQKAARQLQASRDAIRSGTWKLRDIFDLRVDVKPSSVSVIVLTWWDVFDPFKGTADADIATANFSAFKYLYTLANGSLKELHEALLELSALPCPGHLLSDGIAFNAEKIHWRLDKQTDALPPMKDSRRLMISRLATKAIEDVASFPDDWQQQAQERGFSLDEWTFYS